MIHLIFTLIGVPFKLIRRLYREVNRPKKHNILFVDKRPLIKPAPIKVKSNVLENFHWHVPPPPKPVIKEESECKNCVVLQNKINKLRRDLLEYELDKLMFPPNRIEK